MVSERVTLCLLFRWLSQKSVKYRGWMRGFTMAKLVLLKSIIVSLTLVPSVISGPACFDFEQHHLCNVDTGKDSHRHRGCPMFCTLDFKPVCGSNNVTYSNECHLKAARCRSGPRDLQIAYQGECKLKGMLFFSSKCKMCPIIIVCILLFRSLRKGLYWNLCAGLRLRWQDLWQWMPFWNC